jgi:RNA polymerase sigma-70 factor, ECF subfamily
MQAVWCGCTFIMDSTSQFVRLWTRHQAEVGRYVSTMLPRADAVVAAEVLQEVSVRLWEKWAEYDEDRPFVPWAIRFAYLEVLKWRQRQARERLVFSDALVEQLHTTYEEEAPLMEARRRALDACLEKLGTQERRWVTRRYERHGTLQNEARSEGMSLNQIYYAMEKIRARLLDCIGLTLKQEGWTDA